MTNRLLASLAVALTLRGFAVPARAQTLETETARLLKPHQSELGYAFELQRSSEGTERAMPLLFVYGVTNRLELMIEPVPSTVIRPKAGRAAAGAGDVEVTLTYRLRQERGRQPALAVAGEVKLPTARNQLIGTGKPDVALFVSASKRFGPLDTHAHVSYTVVGQPGGARLGNIVGIGVAAVFPVGSRFDLFGEVLSGMASTPGAEGGSAAGIVAPVAPEATGGELVATIGTAWHARPWLELYASGSRDNIGAVLIRSGLIVRLH